MRHTPYYYFKRHLQKLRYAVLEKYGGKCQCCGVEETVFLALDHVFNDGAARRKAGDVGRKLWRRLAHAPRQPDFQILCHNCNFAKSHGGCPHIFERNLRTMKIDVPEPPEPS